MAKKVTALIKLQVNAGKATPAPPQKGGPFHYKEGGACRERAGPRRADQHGFSFMR